MPSPARAVASPRAFTLVELLVVIGIIGLLVSILLPAVGAVREQSRSVKCLTNLRSIGQAVQTYATDHDGALVPCDVRDLSVPAGPNGFTTSETWATILVAGKYLPAPAGVAGNPDVPDNVFKCPNGILELVGTSSITTGLPVSREDRTGAMATQMTSKGLNPGRVIFVWYGTNGTSNAGQAYIPMQRCPPDNADTGVPRKILVIKRPAEVVLMFDGIGVVNYHQQNANRISARHGSTGNRRTNFLFADGHVASVLTRDLPGGAGDANNGAGAAGAQATFSLANLKNYPYPKFRLDQ
jgi:prepilin-type N-terminal cleavage/methylation domain-containing protein/prepilin-type processing-associated H-X9-DG protein